MNTSKSAWGDYNETSGSPAAASAATDASPGTTPGTTPGETAATAQAATAPGGTTTVAKVEIGGHFNWAYMVEILKYALVTAAGYMAWQYYTTHAKRNWSKGITYWELFLFVFIALLVTNFVFTILFQRQKLFLPPLTALVKANGTEQGNKS